MKITLLLVILMLPSVAWSSDDKKRALIDDILNVVHARENLEKLRIQNVDLVKKEIYSTKNEYADNPIMKRLNARVIDKYNTYITERMSWTRWEPKYVQMYDELYTEDELKGLLSFLKSDAGIAWTRANPIIASRMQAGILEQRKDTEAKIDQIMKDTMAEIKAEVDSEGLTKRKSE